MIAKLHFISQETELHTHLQTIEAACKAGVQWVQLRIKNKPEEEVLSIAKKAKEICDKYNAKLIINDYPAIAKEIGAYGLHLGKEDMPVSEARKIVGNMIIGASANTLEDIINHAKNNADYIGLGPFRFTATKKKLSPVLGIEVYKTIMQECEKRGITTPIIAIGGIEANDIPPLMEAGIYGVAISGAIVNAKDILQTVQHINSLLNVTEYVNHSR
jgi:thiamine-phosphate pyrophosphorylase